MSDIYSVGERVVIYIVIAIVALVLSLVYLFCRINRKKVSWFIFVLCFLYFALFIFLNFISMFDLVFNNEKGFENFSKVISKFYEIFDYIDKALGFLIFPLIIYYLESGYYTIPRKILDGLWGIIYEFIQPLVLSLRIILCIVLLVITIKYRKHFGLGKNLFDYIFVILDCYSIIDIYMCVGFFMVQIFVDCKTQKNKKLKDRYYRYSLIKIIRKTESYINKMNKLHETLDKNIQNYDKDKSSLDYKHMKDTYQKIDEKIKEYQEESHENNPNSNNNENMIDYSKANVQQTNNYNENINQNNNDYMGAINYLHNYNQPNDKTGQQETDNQMEVGGEQAQNVEIKKNNEENKPKKEKKLSPVDCNKKYKKYIRRIDKLKLLYQVIERDYNPMTISNNRCICCCNVILFITFGIAICTDFILPIALNMRDDFIDDSGEFKKTEESKFALAVSVIISLAICVVTSSYTIITIYSSKRRRYISGDYLYDKMINDNLSLLKTVQFICGFSFAVIYCNLYFWKTLDKKGVFGRPYYYDQVIIPDYTLKNGITIYMIIKIIIIIISILAALIIKLTKISFFKNDLTEFNSKSWRQSKYDNDQELNRVINENKGIVNILKREIKY
jgi:hypothetical protein